MVGAVSTVCCAALFWLTAVQDNVPGDERTVLQTVLECGSSR